MRYMKFAGVLVAAIVVASCADSNPSPMDPQPDLRFGKSTSSICDAASNRAIKADQELLFAGSDLRAIQKLWSAVTAKCSTTNPDAANTELLLYVRDILTKWSTNRAAILPVSAPDADKATAITAHFDRTFSFVGYADPDLRPELLTLGAAKVITSIDLAGLPTGGSIEFGIPGIAAMTVGKQLTGGDSRGHLFVLYQVTPTLTNPCLQNVGGLDQAGACIEFSAFPEPPTTDFNPLLTVGVCFTGSVRNGALGHYDTGAGTTVLTRIDDYPSTGFCHGTAAPLPPRFGAAGMLDRFTTFAHALFAPNVAYASHAGLGGLTPCCSFFKVVDQSVFSATFDGVVIGNTPDSGDFASPDRGTWTRVVAQSPGSITVAGSLADMATQPVVLNQGGGACGDACGGLDLWGQIRTAAAVTAVSAGKYSVRWTSVQNHSNPKLAPFVIRSSDDSVIARLAYARVSGVNQLLYNGVALTNVTWAKGAKQTFEIIVDFTSTSVVPPATTPTVTPTTTLKIDGTARASNKPFVGAATNLSKIQAEFSGIDSGIIGWDNITIDRIPDR